MFWSENEVKQWLAQIGCSEEVQHAFVQAKITGSHLLDITREEIESTGAPQDEVPKIVHEVGRLKQNESTKIDE